MRGCGWEGRWCCGQVGLHAGKDMGLRVGGCMRVCGRVGLRGWGGSWGCGWGCKWNCR